MRRGPQAYESMWPGGQNPTSTVTPGGQILYRVTFYVDVPATVYGIRMYREFADGGNHTAVMIKRGTAANRDAQRSCCFIHNLAGIGYFAWNNRYLGQPVDLAANEWWDLIMWTSGGIYSGNAGELTAGDFVTGMFHVPRDGATDPFGNVVANSALNGGVVTMNPNVSIAGMRVALDVLALRR